MSGQTSVYTVRVHHEQRPWAEVRELPGCFASGADMDELWQALGEAISLYLSEPGHEVYVELHTEPGPAAEQRVLARTA